MVDVENGEMRPRSLSDNRTCWVCFATDEDDPLQKWLRPCKCRGTTKWVHNTCLQRWFDEKQRGNPAVHVSCPQCNTLYIIRYPEHGPFLYLIQGGEKIVDKVCPVAAMGVVVGSLYWSAVTFGAISVMQVMGHKRGLEIMEQADPLFLLVGLPTIPFGLILAKMIKWEDWVLQKWREQSSKWWVLKKLFGNDDNDSRYPVRIPLETNTQVDFISSTRVLCGALMLPTFATNFGNYFFGKVDSPLKRAFMGGAVFIVAKGIIQIYYKQQQYMRLARRQIENYTETQSTQSTQSTETSTAV